MPNISINNQTMLSISCLRCELFLRVRIPESYFQMLEFWVKRVKTSRAREHMGTMKTRAGWGCSKYFIARQVVSKLRPQAKRVEQKRGNVNSYNFLGFLLLKMQVSISYLTQRESSRPGRTISPRPSMLNFIELSSLSKQGNCSLSGRSMLFATVTMTSVSQTQKRSQKKRSQSTGKAILKDLMFASLIAIRLNAIPQRLSMSQCLVMTSRSAGKKQTTGKMMLIRKSRMTHASYAEIFVQSRQSLVRLETYLNDTFMQQKVDTTIKIAFKTNSLVICSNSFTKKYNSRSTIVAVRGQTPISQQRFKKPPPSSRFLNLFSQF